MSKTLIIQGSSRSNGNTNKTINYLTTLKDYDVIDLYDKKIGHFDYNFSNKDDDFLPLSKEVIETYDTIIFATPEFNFQYKIFMPQTKFVMFEQSGHNPYLEEPEKFYKLFEEFMEIRKE